MFIKKWGGKLWEVLIGLFQEEKTAEKISENWIIIPLYFLSVAEGVTAAF